MAESDVLRFKEAVDDSEYLIFEPIFEILEDKYFDFFCINKAIFINDYTFFTGYKIPEEISSIEKLRDYINNLLMDSVNILKHIMENVDLSISNEERDSIVNQVIFDILFDNYIIEQREQPVCRSDYARYMSEIFNGIIGEYDIVDSDAIRKAIERKMNDFSDMVKNSNLKEQVQMLGLDPEKYIEYMKAPKKISSNHNRAKYEWDFFLFNSYMLTGIQYNRRRLKSTAKSKNYSYQDKIDDILKYIDFVDEYFDERRIPLDYDNVKNQKVFAEKGNYTESAKDYFIKTMEYYYLESYKRVDFMMKYAIYMDDSQKKIIDDEYLLLLKRFHPSVASLIYYSEDNTMNGREINKYYRPLLFIEDSFLDKVFIKRECNINNALIQLLKCNIIRAKVYELFKFHARFNIDDFEKVRDFIDNFYNLRKFHMSVSVDIQQYLFDSKKYKNIIKKFIMFNSYLFPDREENREGCE